jgi:hypothetical protein
MQFYVQKYNFLGYTNRINSCKTTIIKRDFPLKYYYLLTPTLKTNVKSVTFVTLYDTANARFSFSKNVSYKCKLTFSLAKQVSNIP